MKEERKKEDSYVVSAGGCWFCVRKEGKKKEIATVVCVGGNVKEEQSNEKKGNVKVGRKGGRREWINKRRDR